MDKGAELQELSELSGGLVYVQGYSCTTGDGFGQQRSRRLWTGSCGYGVQHISNIGAMETRHADLQGFTLESGSYQDKFVPVRFVEEDTAMDSLGRLGTAGFFTGHDHPLCYRLL